MATGETAQQLTEDNFLTADLVPCGVDRQFPRSPSKPASGAPVGLSFSGGGFRATFAALGVVRYLADIDMLRNLWVSSSVSGGSVANGILAVQWPELRDRDFSSAAVDELLIDPTVRKIADKSLKMHLVGNAWRAALRQNRTDVLARAFDKWFVGSTKMHELDDSVRWVINAANMATGTRFSFEQSIVGDYVNGFVASHDADIKVALAAATSAAVPGAFAVSKLEGLALPCRGADTVRLLDGGAYDNTGIEVLNSKTMNADKDDVFTICLAAGGLFKVGGYGRIPLVRDLKQSNAVLYRQTRALRTGDMVQRFLDGDRNGLLFKLNTSQTAVETAADASLDDIAEFIAHHPAVDRYNDQELAYVGTSFDQFDEGLSRRLVHRGWWAAGLTMAAFHPDKAPAPSTLTAPTF